MIFAPTKPERIAEKQKEEAKRLYLEHMALAEYHQAIARMCAERIERLNTHKEQKQ